MAVLDGTWWSAWWGAMVWWLVAFAGLVTLVVLGVRSVLKRLGKRAEEPHYLPLYLDNDAVMDVFKMRNHQSALRKEVEERNVRNTGWLAAIPVLSWMFQLHGDRATEIVAKYVKESEPIQVIGLLLSVLQRGDGLARVRLQERPATVRPNRALLAAGVTDHVVLSEIGEFVMITGRFEAQEAAGDTLVMRASYGDGEQSAHLRVVLRVGGLRPSGDRKLPEGQFRAHCLGKVTTWRPDTREVVLQYPVAVFQ
ncbi:hypothetical protein [Streptomyces sp. NBC_00557]|uniref:hypothetical protein n=1 Tax=Streptomyces sp. NBC_00557 TaxID=2975776 RepID=UPI002E80EAC7|nr:hypothetical protein [Streptomyces sp. NBC_00557]WUC35408.1 hypothetical protein OG956_14830 [Streptomyces sp. NBC_00557]